MFQNRLPLYCFLGQHSVACEEGETADDGQVLEGLEHVEVGPVHVHKAQHGCRIKTTTMESSVYSTFRYIQGNRTRSVLMENESNLLGLCHTHITIDSTVEHSYFVINVFSSGMRRSRSHLN